MRNLSELLFSCLPSCLLNVFPYPHIFDVPLLDLQKPPNLCSRYWCFCKFLFFVFSRAAYADMLHDTERVSLASVSTILQRHYMMAILIIQQEKPNWPGILIYQNVFPDKNILKNDCIMIMKYHDYILQP